MSECILDPCVEDELWEIWYFIAQNNPDAAARVIEAAYKTFKMPAANPDVGRPRRFRDPKLRDVRSWRIAGFENYLIFYRRVAGGIQVIHVYHGARDIEALLGESA
jgi:toxin ParE1/3/4